MRLRTIKRRFGIAAPRMAVRTHVAWYWRWALLGFTLAAGLAFAWWMYGIGSTMAGFDRGAAEDRLGRLSRQVDSLRQQNGLLQGRLAASERQLQMELATQKALTQSIRTLQDAKAHLNDDLAFFRDLMSPSGKEGTVSIYRFKVGHNLLPGEYRYRLLLLQAGKRERPFRGRMQLLVTVMRKGEKSVIEIPPAKESGSHGLSLKFKYYQRVEGAFKTAPDATVESVQVRVFEKGATQPKLTQTVNLS